MDVWFCSEKNVFRRTYAMNVEIDSAMWKGNCNYFNRET